MSSSFDFYNIKSQLTDPIGISEDTLQVALTGDVNALKEYRDQGVRIPNVVLDVFINNQQHACVAIICSNDIRFRRLENNKLFFSADDNARCILVQIVLLGDNKYRLKYSPTVWSKIVNFQHNIIAQLSDLTENELELTALGAMQFKYTTFNEDCLTFSQRYCKHLLDHYMLQPDVKAVAYKKLNKITITGISFEDTTRQNESSGLAMAFGLGNFKLILYGVLGAFLISIVLNLYIILYK